jgi:uncharacterized protein (TIGR02186 family)
MSLRLALPLSLTLLSLTVPSMAQPGLGQESVLMPAGLAQDSIEINVNFTGSTIVLFASTPQPENATSGLAVALIGPPLPQAMVQRTQGGERTIDFASAPAVFAVGAEAQVLVSAEREALERAGLDPAGALQPSDSLLTSPNLPVWRDAFVTLKKQQGLYIDDAADIRRFPGGLSRATITLPANAPPGEYRVRAVAFRNGQPVGATDQTLLLQRTGLEATLFDLSSQHGVVYGIVAVLLGCLVGGAAAWLGRKS